MPVVYNLPNEIKALRDRGFFYDPLFMETDDYLEIDGKTYNKKSLSEEKVNRMKRLSFADSSNIDNVNTTTQSYSNNNDGRIIGGHLPFSKEDTVMRNSVSFNDGTEIKASDNSGHSRTSLFAFKHGKLNKRFDFSNGMGKTPLVKLSENAFVVINNNSTYTLEGYNTAAAAGLSILNQSDHHAASLTKFPVDGVTGLNLYSKYGNFHYRPSSNSIAYLTTPTNGYSSFRSINHYTTLALFDKELNFIKELSIKGRLINIPKISDKGNLIVLVEEYSHNVTDGYQTILKICSVDSSLVMTTLFEEIVRQPFNDTVSSTVYSFSSQEPYFKRDTNEVFYLNMLNGIRFKRLTINFETEVITSDPREEIKETTDNLDGTATGAVTYIEKGIPLQGLESVFSYTDYYTNLYRIQINRLVKNGKEYFTLSNIIAPIVEQYKHDNLYVSSMSSTYRSASNNFSYFGNTYELTEMPLYLLSIDMEQETYTVKDTLPLSNNATNGLKCVYTLGTDFISTMKRKTGINLYTIEPTTEKFKSVETISDQIKTMGVDSSNRIWFIRDVNDYGLEMISPYLSTDVTIKFEDTSLSYSNKNIETAVIVDSVNLAGNRQEVEIKILLEGNAIFRDTQSKTVTVVTSSSQEIRVPIVITGAGSINAYIAHEG